jgi:hypothetical protein
LSTIFIRHKKERNYTVVDNLYLQDDSLSWKAKGLFTYLLSLPEDWQIHLEEIEKHAPDGRDSLRTAVKELKDRGFLVLRQRKDKRGKFSHNEVEVVERPNPPLTGFPSTGKPTTENPKLISTNEQSTNEQTLLSNKNSTVPSPEVQEVYNFYLKCFKKDADSYKLSDARQKKLVARLRPKDAGKEMLMRAIEKTSKSPHHLGKNDRKWKANLDWIIKNYEQVENLSNLELNTTSIPGSAPKKPSAPPPAAIERERVVSPEEAEKNRIILELVRMKKASFSDMKELKTKTITELENMKNENNHNGSDTRAKEQ